jgi:hypothetical protein
MLRHSSQAAKAEAWPLSGTREMAVPYVNRQRLLIERLFPTENLKISYRHVLPQFRLES